MQKYLVTIGLVLCLGLSSAAWAGIHFEFKADSVTAMEKICKENLELRTIVNLKGSKSDKYECFEGSVLKNGKLFEIVSEKMPDILKPLDVSTCPVGTTYQPDDQTCLIIDGNKYLPTLHGDLESDNFK